jgi:hypothetical protein
MLCEADLIAKWAALRWLVQQHPEWTHQDLADALDLSRPWVSKWLQRLRQTDPDDVMALHSRPCARHTPPVSIASQPTVVQRILEIRAEPPENLQRVPGPEAILYYLHRDPALKHAGVRLPRSQTTVWKILHQAGCIEQDRRRKPRPLELREPGEEVQFDLKDASSVLADPEGKRQHVVEIANFVDAGTSIWLHHQVGSDFDAEALFEVVVQFLHQHGLPGMLTFDNDPRFVGSASGRDFPSALVRFLWCVGVTQSADPAASTRQECLRNGVIAKDKFCLSRSVRLNRSQEKRFEHPVEQDHRSSQEQTHTTALPILEHSAPLSSLLPWVEAASIRRISRCLPANCLVLLQATDGREAMRTAIYVRVSTVRASAEPDHRTTTGAATDALPGPLLGLAGRADLSR